jgi:hypothetical protein
MTKGRERVAMYCIILVLLSVVVVESKLKPTWLTTGSFLLA